MRKIIIVSFLGLLAVLLYRRCESPPNPEQAVPAQTTRSDIQEGEQKRSEGEPMREEGVARTVKSLPRLPGHDAKPKVVIERGPRRPGEDPQRYEERVWFAERFDAFVRESGVNEAQVQELLLALYDYTTQRRHSMDMMREDVRRDVTVDQSYIDAVFGDDLHNFMMALQRILDVEQRAAYFEHCSSCAQEIAYHSHHEPILRLEGER